jgi:WD40 repeat protein
MSIARCVRGVVALLVIAGCASPPAGTGARGLRVAKLLPIPPPRTGGLGLAVVPQTGHFGDIHDVALSHDGSLLATGGADRSLLVWDLRSGKLLRRIEHANEVYSVQFSSDDRSVFAVAGATIVESSIVDGKTVWSVDETPNLPRSAAPGTAIRAC